MPERKTRPRTTSWFIQASVVLAASWLIGAGFSTAPASQLPVAAALHVTLFSRGVTRPLRLALEIWLSIHVGCTLADVTPRRRIEAALRWSLIAIAGMGGMVAILCQCDRMLGGASGAAAACTARGINPLRAKSHFPPLALLFRALSRVLLTILSPLLARIGSLRPLEPLAVAEAVSSLCTLIRVRVRCLSTAFQTLAEGARKIKPLNALLDLSETDAWAAEAMVALAHRVRAALS